MIPWDWPAGRYHREQLPQGQSWQCRGVACDWLPNSPCDWSTFWPQRPAAENRIPSPHSRWSSGNAAGWSPSTRRTIMFTAGVCMIGETSKSKLYFESIHPSRLPQEWLLSKTYGCELPDNTDADHLVALTGQLGDVLVNRLLFNKLPQLFSLINIQINISFSATISHTHTQRSWMYISLKRLPGPAVTALCSRYVLCSSVTGLVGEQICCFPSGNACVVSLNADRQRAVSESLLCVLLITSHNFQPTCWQLLQLSEKRTITSSGARVKSWSASSSTRWYRRRNRKQWEDSRRTRLKGVVTNSRPGTN